jgi:hypothetical protein
VFRFYLRYPVETRLAASPMSTRSLKGHLISKNLRYR